MPKPPVIFLAFANDLGDYLHKLSDEKDAIREALEQMQDEEICEILYETNTSLEQIWDVFDKYQERIAIFHYGGHAEDYALLLQNSLGEQQLVNGEGLVSFLARQKGLQLVFLNGCSSKRQAEELRDKGIPAVIGTSEPIDDSAAKILAETFYKSLANGRSIKQAWMGAKDRLIADQKKNEQGYYRSVGRRARKRELTKQFPWELYIRPGAELVEGWNLPKAASNPLFGLPLPDEAFRNLPPAPFVGLHYFTREDAAIFHGRGVQIRELYNHLQGIHPIILVYGKSGVGKSSMLDAGFRPRIEDQYEITYARRIQEKGLLGTLDMALDQLLIPGTDTMTEDQEFPLQKIQDYLRLVASNMSDQRIRQLIEGFIDQLEQNPAMEVGDLTAVLKKWLVVEEQSGKPLVVILDQVEEKFTRPMPTLKGHQQDELEVFLLALQPLFSQESSGIKGKIILSYRKEYHPEISDALQSLALPFSKLFLKRLDRDGIIEAISGTTSYDKKENGLILHNPKYNPYRLELEDSRDGYLPEIIAEDLMEDPESPIAPVLQIILEKLWEKAPKVAGQGVKLTIAQYQDLSKQGTTMHEFFQEQMTKMAERHLQAFSSGLILDILLAHTTDVGTAGSCLREELLQQYAMERTEFIQILQSLENLTLLVRIDKGKEERQSSEELYTTLLAHDTLAPVVIREHNLSDAPGQRADRILGNKLADVGCQLLASYLEKLRITGIPDTVLQELTKPIIGWDKFLAFLRHKLGEEVYQQQAGLLLDEVVFDLQPYSQAVYLEEIDLRIVEEGCGLVPDHFPGRRKLFKGEQLLVEESKHRRTQRLEAEQRAQAEKQALQDKVTRRQRIFIVVVSIAFLLAAYSAFFANEQARKARVAALPGLALEALEYDQTKALNFAMAYQAEQVNILGDSLTKPLRRILNIPERKFHVTKYSGHSSRIAAVAFSPNSKEFVTSSEDGKVILWSIKGEHIRSFRGRRGKVTKMAFAPNSRYIVIEKWVEERKRSGYFEWETSIYDRENDQESLVFAKDAARFGAFSEDGQTLYMVIQGGGGYIKIDGEWKKSDQVVKKDIITLDEKILWEEDVPADTIIFSPFGKYILTIETEVQTKVKTEGERGIPTRRAPNNYKLWDLRDSSRLDNASTKRLDSLRFEPLSFSPNEDRLIGGLLKIERIGPRQFGKFGYLDLKKQKLEAFTVRNEYRRLIWDDGLRAHGLYIWDQQGGYWNTENGETRKLTRTFARIDYHPTRSIAVGYKDGYLVSEGPDWPYRTLVNQKFSTYAFSPDGEWVISGNKQGEVFLWSLIDQPQLPTFMDSNPTSLTFSKKNDILVTGDENGWVRIWDQKSSTVLDSFEAYKTETQVSSLAISPDGQYILTGSANGVIKRWNRTGREQNTFPGPNGVLAHLEFSPDANTILAEYEEEGIRIWSVTDQKLLLDSGKKPDSYSFSPNGQLFLYCTKPNSREEVTVVQKLSEPLSQDTFRYPASAFVRQENLSSALAYLDDTGLNLLPNIPSSLKDQIYSLRESVSRNQFLRIIASPDGKRLVAEDAKGLMQTWYSEEFDAEFWRAWDDVTITASSLESPNKKNFAKQTFSNNTDFFVSPDNKYLVRAFRSLADDYLIELWNPFNGELLQTIKAPSGLFPEDKRNGYLALSPNGHFLYKSDGKQVHIWPTYLWELQEGRIWNKAYKFSKEEQEQFGITWDY